MQGMLGLGGQTIALITDRERIIMIKPEKIRSHLTAGLFALEKTGEPFFTCHADRAVLCVANRLGVRVSTANLIVVDPASAESRKITQVLPKKERNAYRGVSLGCSQPLPVSVRLLKKCDELGLDADTTRELLGVADELK